MKRALRLYDPLLFALALASTLLGLVFIFDAGYARSLRDGKGPIPREFLMQVPFLLIAVVGCYLVAAVRPEQWKRWSKIIWLFSLTLLALVFVPGLRYEMSGAHRWIKIGPLLLQPAEFAKISTILYLAGVFAERKAWPEDIKPRKNFPHWMDTVVVPKLLRCMPALWVLVGIYLINKEPDLGTAAVIVVAAFAMFIIGGVSRKALIVAMLLGGLGMVVMIKQQPYRMDRILNHSTRWSGANMDDSGWQSDQSELAMASGGIGGVGIGGGRVKHVTPAATTDYIYATIAEEFGFVGSLVVLALMAGIVFRLLFLAMRAQTHFACLVLSGVATWIGVQACTNIMMANGFLPSIGIPLPFFSSGGSSLISLWLAMGLCQSALAPIPEKEVELAADGNRWRNRRPRLSGA